MIYTNGGHLYQFHKSFIKSATALSKDWALKQPIKIILTCKLEKKSTIPVRESKNNVSESKGGQCIDIYETSWKNLISISTEIMDIVISLSVLMIKLDCCKLLCCCFHQHCYYL